MANKNLLIIGNNIFINSGRFRVSQKLLGIKKIVENTNNDLSKELMKLIIDLRDNSKKNKDWETADIIRDKLSEINIQIKDTREGTNWELNE